MPKRLCNSKGRTQARFGRIRIGWRKQRLLKQYEELNKAEKMGQLEEDAAAKFAMIKDAVKSVIPKQILRRHQAR